MDNDKFYSDCLKGKKGEAKAMMAKAIVSYAESRGADLLLDIAESKGYVPLFAYRYGEEEIYRPLDLLVNSGESSKNGFYLPPPIRGKLPLFSPFLAQKGQRERALEERLRKLGGDIEKRTCIPYGEKDDLYGRVLAYGSAPAAAFVSSYYGAYAEPLPALIALYCNIMGKVPAVGFFLKENRAASYRVGVYAEVLPEPYLLARAIASKCDGVAYIKGLANPLGRLGKEEAEGYVRAFAAAMALEGRPLFHIDGITREAKESGESLLKPDWKEIAVSPKEIDSLYGSIAGGNVRPSAVVMGCPELTLTQMESYTRLLRNLGGGHLRHPVYFNSSKENIEKFLSSPSGIEFAKMGGKTLSVCLFRFVADSGLGKSRIVTSSPALSKLGVAYLSARDALRLASEGRI